MPYQSGVARIGGPGRNRTSCVGRRLVYSQPRPMARPTHREARWRWPRQRCLCSCQGADARARKPGASTPRRDRTPGRRCWGPRRHHGSSARIGQHAHRHAAGQRKGGNSGGAGELPARPGSAGIGRFPRPRPLLMTKRLAGPARIRAEAQGGRCGGDGRACHRRLILRHRLAAVNRLSHPEPDARAPVHGGAHYPPVTACQRRPTSRRVRPGMSTPPSEMYGGANSPAVTLTAASCSGVAALNASATGAASEEICATWL